MNNDLSTLKTFTPNKRRKAMEALSALSKFLGIYDDFKRLIKAHGLKWQVDTDDVIIARLLKYNNNGNENKNNGLFEWIKTVKRQIPELKTFVDFITASGLRFDEALNAFNLIVELTRSGRLSEYYNIEQQTLEHFRFRTVFIRRTKKVYMGFVPCALIETIGSKSSTLTKDTICKRIQRLKLPLCFSDIREFYASFSTKHLRQPEIDFLQGRVSASVFMRNYFNPTWISDLKDRALKNASELLKLTATD